MFNLGILSQFSRLAISATNRTSLKNVSASGVLQFHTSNQLWAEPLKKKKKMDPAIVKAREERRRKKLEKQIRRLEKNARQLKPIDEVEPPLHLLDEKGRRKRNIIVPEQEQEARALLLKEWSRYKKQEYMNNIAQIDRIMASQKRALDMLYEESEDLYNEAIMPDLSLVPYSASGPYLTPPIKNYDSPDGDYIDISKKWGNN